MRLFKKTMAVALASVMTIGMAGVASAAPVPAGTNVLAGRLERKEDGIYKL